MENPNLSNLNILLEEKKLVFNQKLDLLKTLKQVGTINIVLTTLSGSAISLDVTLPFVVIPPLMLIFYWYMVSTLMSYNLICSYLYKIEEIIINASEKTPLLPLFQYTVGHYKIVKPPKYNYILIIFCAIWLSLTFAYGTLRGYKYFDKYDHGIFKVIYLIGLSIAFLITVGFSIYYALRYREIADKTVEEAFQK